VERKLLALWEAIRRATETGDWRPSPSRLCDWCNYRALCPAFGGTPPPYPLPVATEPPRGMTSIPPAPAEAGSPHPRAARPGAAPQDPARG
jgi:putative RecB family exonuclease